MPLIISEADRNKWLGDISETEIKDLMKPYPDGELTAHPVTRDINKGADNDERMIEVCDNGLNLALE